LIVDGSPGRLIPFVLGDVVQSIDLERGLIQVDWDVDFL